MTRAAASLRSGVPAGAASDKGDTAPHWAAVGGHVAVLEDLLAAGADWAVECDWGEFHTARRPLLWAARGGRAPAIQVLLIVGAEVHAKDNCGWTALHSAGRSGRAEAVDALLAAGADVHAKDNGGSTALHSAFKAGCTRAVESMTAARATFNVANNDGWELLHFAVSRGHTPVVAALLRLGADPTPVCCTGETPLCIAIMLGHRDIIDLLPPTHPTNAVCTPALEAVKRWRVDLLDNDRVRPSLHDPDRTTQDRVLHVAARRADATTVGALLRRYVDARGFNIADEMPLGSAVSWYAKKLSAARDLAGVMVGRPDLHLRAVAEERQPPPPRRDGLTPGAVSDAMRRQLRDWRLGIVMLLHGGAVTKRLCQSSVKLCARVVASFPLLGPQQAVRLLCTRQLTCKAQAGDAEVFEELK